MIDDKTEPAFPQHRDTLRWAEQCGMSLRDYFAANAIAAYFSDGTGFNNTDDAASWAYALADDMLEARKT